MPAPLVQFVELCQRLAETGSKLEKRALMAEYLRALPVPEAGLAALYLAGIPFAETDGRELKVGGALLSGVIAKLSGANQAAMHAAYLRHGDLGGAAQDLLQGRSVTPTLELHGVAEAFAAIAGRKPAAKQLITLELLRTSRAARSQVPDQDHPGRYAHRHQGQPGRGGDRRGLWRTIGEVRHARMLNGNLPEVLEMAATGRLSEARMKLFHPLGFMLASPVETVEEALQRFSDEVGGEAQGPIIKEAQLEDKYDGVRAQIHCGSPEQPGRVAIFSRSREDMTPSFPELVEAFSGFDQPLILDGEILAWSRTTDRALPFASLQGRLGRKRVTAEMREATPVVFMAFDLLYANGEMTMERPLLGTAASAGRAGAAGAAANRGGQPLVERPAGGAEFRTGYSRRLCAAVLAPAVQLQSVAQLEQAYVDARARGNEGVMLKARHSIYQPGRRGLAWLKLKRELATLDVVVTAAEYGHGRRAGWLSDYTFAVSDGEMLRNVGKAYSGVTDAEIARLTQFFLEHTVEDYGSVRAVEPLVVLEVAFNNVMRSDRHDSGFALRFPRILRIRDDKPVSEIDTLERVAEIYQSQPDKPVETAGWCGVLK